MPVKSGVIILWGGGSGFLKVNQLGWGGAMRLDPVHKIQLQLKWIRPCNSILLHTK